MTIQQPLQTLLRINKRINRALALPEIFEIALGEALQTLGLNNGQVMLSDPAHHTPKQLWRVVEGEWCNDFATNDSSIQQRILAHVTQTGATFHCPGSGQHFEQDDCLCEGQGIGGWNHAMLCVPIASQGRVLGALGVESKRPDLLLEDSVEFLAALAEQVAIAIEAQLLRTIGMELSTLTVDEMQHKVCEYTCILLGAASSAIVLLDSKTGGFVGGSKYPSLQPADHPRQDGLTRLVLEAGQPVIISDAQNHSLVKASSKARGVRSILGAPLRILRKRGADATLPCDKAAGSLVCKRGCQTPCEVTVIGVLFANMLQSREFSDRDLELLQSLASQAAVAIENAQLLERVQSRANDFEALQQLSLQLNSSQKVSAAYAVILASAVRLANAKAGVLYTLDGSLRKARVEAIINRADLQSGRTRSAKKGVVGEVIEHRETFSKSDYRHWKKRWRGSDPYNFSVVAGAPMKWGDELVGVIAVNDDRQGRDFTAEELHILSIIGSLAAVAIKNVRQKEELIRMMANAFDAIIAVTPQGQITHFNQQAEQLLGYRADQVIGQHISLIYDQMSDARTVMQQLRRRSEGRISNHLTTLRNKEGQPISIRLSAALIYDSEGSVTGTVGFFRGVGMVEAGQAVIRSLDLEQIFNSIVEHAWRVTGASQSSHLALKVDHQLVVKAAYPPEHLPRLQAMLTTSLDAFPPTVKGVARRVFESGKPALVHNVQEDRDYIAYDPETHSELAVPIILNGQTIGVIDVEHAGYTAFGLKEQARLVTIAEYAAIAIHHAQLYEQREQEKNRFKALAEIIRYAATNLEITSLLRTACQLLEEQMADKQVTASIRLYDADQNILRFDPSWHHSFHARIDVAGQKGRTTQLLNEGICGWVATRKLGWNVADVDREPLYLRVVSSTQSELAIPICHGEAQTLIGVLDVQSTQRAAFDPNDVEYLEVLAGQLAVIIHNARLYEQTERLAGIRQTLYQAGRLITSPKGLDEALNQIAEQVWQLAQVQGKEINSVVLRIVRQGKRLLVAAYPQTIASHLRQLGWQEIEIEKGTEGKIGIMGRAILSGKTQAVADVSSDPDYLPLNLATRSELAIPIQFKERVLAAMNIEYPVANGFTQDDVRAFEALADLAGILIHNADEYETLYRRNRHQQAVYEASRIISNGFPKEQKELLQRILQQAVEQIQPAHGQVNRGVIQLYDPEKNLLVWESAYPETIWQDPALQNSQRRPLNRSLTRIGIQGRAVLTRTAQRVDDVRSDPDYVMIDPGSRSELDVPLVEGSHVLGVLGLESDTLAAFDAEDQRALENLAELAVIAIRNAHQYHDLEKTRQLLAVHEVVALQGMDRGNWRHKMIGYLGSIENHIKLLHYDLETAACRDKLKDRLSSIEMILSLAREKKKIEPLSHSEGIKPIALHAFLQEWSDQFFWKHEWADGVEHLLHLDPACEVTVRVNPKWLGIALNNLANNALRAMNESNLKHFTVQTQRNPQQIEIHLSDSGPGIPPVIQQRLFRTQIEKRDGAQGEGIGALHSYLIIQTYQGDIQVLETGPNGTTIVIRLPCE